MCSLFRQDWYEYSDQAIAAIQTLAGLKATAKKPAEFEISEADLREANESWSEDPMARARRLCRVRLTAFALGEAYGRQEAAKKPRDYDCGA